MGLIGLKTLAGGVCNPAWLTYYVELQKKMRKSYLIQTILDDMDDIVHRTFGFRKIYRLEMPA